MARRKKAGDLTNFELKIMRIIWRLKRATAQEVKDALAADKDYSYSTILTMLRILERKGFLRHVKMGRSFCYFPAASEKRTVRELVRNFIDRLFDGSAQLLVLNLLENKEVGPEDLQAIRRLIEAKEREAQHGRNT